MKWENIFRYEEIYLYYKDRKIDTFRDFGFCKWRFLKRKKELEREREKGKRESNEMDEFELESICF